MKIKCALVMGTTKTPDGKVKKHGNTLFVVDNIKPCPLKPVRWGIFEMEARGVFGSCGVVGIKDDDGNIVPTVHDPIPSGKPKKDEE